MAEQQNPGVNTNTFNKGLVKDLNETFLGSDVYTHARNSVNNSQDGSVGVIGNEPANIHCVTLPYDLIGSIHLSADEWAVFTTNDVESEIGIFDESACTYTKVVNDRCLGFKRSNLITGASRSRYDCERLIYWDDDGLNPTRTMNLDNVPFKYTDKIKNDCIVRTFTDELDCEAIRMAPLVAHPCLKLKKGSVAGTMLNGSYQAVVAYTIKGVRVGDYIGHSNIQSIFSNQNSSGSLELIVESIDKNFDEFELVIISNINSQTVAKKMGTYSTAVGTIVIDRWSNDMIAVPIGDIVLRTDSIEKSDAMYTVNKYLLRVGTHSKYKFNYQPQANKIGANWVAVQYSDNYYQRGGHNTSYMRDEQAAFFIRWVYNTGERTESYHIPGRPAVPSDRTNITDTDAFEVRDGVSRQRWQVVNTATVANLNTSTLNDGGVVVASGKMGYWESSERYPALDQFNIWGSLCGKPIRHHKFPDETVDPILNHFNSANKTITLLGVEFNGIEHPLDQNGKPIESIVGYEILKGSREGNKTIIAKGLINNMREYNIPGSDTMTGLYQNYPFNDLREDPYITSYEQTGTNGDKGDKPSSPKLNKYRQDVFSFHGPELTFSNPFLNASEVKIYQELSGLSEGRFESPYQHPKFKQITRKLDAALNTLAVVVGAVQIISAAAGGYSTIIASDKDLPPVTVGTPRVAAEGTFGALGIILTALAVVGNLLIQAAYTVLFGTKVTKQQLLSITLALIPFRQYAAQYNSHGFYKDSASSVEGNRRRKILESGYIGSSLSQFTGDYQVNNINRSRFVIFQIDGALQNPSINDESRFTIGESGAILYKPVTRKISSHYGALKVPMANQYGQLQSIKQIIVTPCVQPSLPILKRTVSTGVIFGGDIYINRFTEKNSMFFFNSWLMGEPDGTENDYTLYSNIPYPRFWINQTKQLGLFSDKAANYRSLDKLRDGNWFYVNEGYFYLFNSGVRDFFVESEINLAQRDWEDSPAKRHYDPAAFTDLTAMFRSDIIKSGNFYKYDYSLSISKLFSNNISWGEILPADYDPGIAATCYTYRPFRLIYSLPQQDEGKKDSWRSFLVNNYWDFEGPVTAVKSINKTGALFMMKQQSPLSFTGVEELQLDGTQTKITIGDGALFSNVNQLQSIVNVDNNYEYASNQSRRASVNTKYGVFWVSQNQGKIFQYTGKLNEISNSGMRWWFSQYLPSQLLKKYPEYPLHDNPVKGVGIQMMYDNTNEILYITKRDYVALRDDYTYDADGNFYYQRVLISFTDPDYFEDASFTISYDPKSESWVSFHDWDPTFTIPGKNHFMTVKDNTIWKHNQRCDRYCNYYGVDYPWEVEFVSTTGQSITTMRSIEYLLEAYRYHHDCRDRFHVLDENFDRAMVYNSEQISGLLKLELKQKNDPLSLLDYPKVNYDGITVQFSKEENKYRFNQFYDITKNRGEFSPINIPMLNTAPNGYQFAVNANYVDYNKSVLEHKKFRHNINKVWLRKTQSGDVKFILKIVNEKLLQSQR